MSILLCDERERKVTQHFKDFSYKILTMTIGDYAICYKDKYSTIIERKSLRDYAASIRDGRLENLNKLLEFREKTNARIIYLIEGLPPKDGKKLISRIPYSTIESSIFHTILRHNIVVMWSRDDADTANILERFVKSSNTLYDKEPGLLEGNMIIEGSYEKEVQIKHEKSDDQILRGIWSVLPGITFTNCTHLMENFAITDLIIGIDPEQLKIIKNASTDKPFTQKVINSITKLQTPDVVKLIAAVPGISKETATILIKQIEWKKFDQYSEEDLSSILIGKTRFASRAKTLLKYFDI